MMICTIPSAVVLLLCHAATIAAAFTLDTKVRVRGEMSIPVPNPSDAVAESVHLDKYMTLPVEQYALVPMPLNSTLSRLPGGTPSEFELVVPPLHFLFLEVQPVVEAVVKLEPDRVVISSDKCELRGSPFISKVRLNDRFDLRLKAELTWNDTTTSALLQEGEEGNGAAAAAHEESPESSISAETCIEVDVDRPMGFRAVPRRVVEKAGNAAMRISMNFILKSFLQGLAKDYARWVEDPAYRKFRAELAEEDDPVAFATPER